MEVVKTKVQKFSDDSIHYYDVGGYVVNEEHSDVDSNNDVEVDVLIVNAIQD